MPLHDLSIADLMLANETALRDIDDVKAYLNDVWDTMQAWSPRL